MTPNTAYVGQRVGYYPDGSKTKTGTVLAVSPPDEHSDESALVQWDDGTRYKKLTMTLFALEQQPLSEERIRGMAAQAYRDEFMS